MPAITRSSVPALTPGTRESHSVFTITSSLPSASAMRFAIRTSYPFAYPSAFEIFTAPFLSVCCVKLKGMYAHSSPTTSLSCDEPFEWVLHALKSTRLAVKTDKINIKTMILEVFFIVVSPAKSIFTNRR